MFEIELAEVEKITICMDNRLLAIIEKNGSCICEGLNELYFFVIWSIIGVVYKVVAQRLHVYMIFHARKIVNVKTWQYILNKLIQEKFKFQGTYDMHVQRNLRWDDILNKLEDSKLPT